MDVYLFGAGASAAEGAPATDEFLAAAWKWLGPAFPEPVARVWRFLERVFGLALAGAGSFAGIPAVDQVFSLVDCCLVAEQGLGPAYDPVRLREVRRDLEYLVCATLRAALAGRSAGAADGPHARFVRRLLAEREPGDYALLSLNYDTLLDGALAGAGARPDYGFGAPDLEERPDNAAARPLLAKLHGSLNWGRCPACDRVEAGPVGASAPDLTCSRCGCRPLMALIVSPTYLKGGMASQLRHIWDLALEAVQRADRLVFAGYSMPPADVHIYQLLRRGLLTRRQAGTPVVEVINRAGSDEARSAKCHHFNRLFGGQVRFDFRGFDGQL